MIAERDKEKELWKYPKEEDKTILFEHQDEYLYANKL